MVAVASDSGFLKFGGDPSGDIPAGTLQRSVPGGSEESMMFNCSRVDTAQSEKEGEKLVGKSSMI